MLIFHLFSFFLFVKRIVTSKPFTFRRGALKFDTSISECSVVNFIPKIKLIVIYIIHVAIYLAYGNFNIMNIYMFVLGLPLKHPTVSIFATRDHFLLLICSGTIFWLALLILPYISSVHLLLLPPHIAWLPYFTFLSPWLWVLISNVFSSLATLCLQSDVSNVYFLMILLCLNPSLRWLANLLLIKQKSLT